MCGAIATNPNIEAEKSVLLHQKDGKYGLITLEGKEITKPIYDTIESVNYKEGTFFVTKDGKVGVINQKGKQIIPNEYDSIIPDNYYDETNNNKTTGYIVSQKTDDGYRYGYINYRGTTILKTEYTELERVTQLQEDKDEYYFIGFKDGQAGLLKNKKEILNYEYQDIQFYALNNLFIIQRNGKQGAVDREGKIVLPIEYDSIVFGGSYINATQNGETLIFDMQGNKQQTNIKSLTKIENTNYYIAIDQSDIYTIVDENKNTIVDDNYTYIEYLQDNYFIVAREGKNGIINIKGDVIVDLKYTSIFRFNDTNLLQAETAENSKIELYNSKMQVVASMENAVIKQYETNSQKYIMLASEDDFKYYDENGNEIQAQNIFANNILFAKKVDGKWGFVDKSGNIVVQAEYDMVTDFNEYGFAGVQKDGKWGVINQGGQIIQEPTYELTWLQPTFLGKYYRINAWYGDARYSDDSKVLEVDEPSNEIDE